jgi:cytidyltransferase-like protein
MKNFKSFVAQIQEEKSKSVVFAFGRFNPVTIGHQKLFEKVASIGSSKDHHVVFASHSHDNKKNPLNPNDKLKFLRKAFPKNNVELTSRTMPSTLQIIGHLYDQGYRDITMVAGSDRISEFKALVKKYNGVKSTHGFYDVKFDVISSGDRDADSEDASGASGTNMRMYARNDDFTSFRKYTPASLSDADAKKIFNLVKGNLTELASQENLIFPSEQIREKFICGEILNPGDTVRDIYEDIEYEVVSRGTNFVKVKDFNGKVHKKWVSDLIEAKDESIEEASTPVYDTYIKGGSSYGDIVKKYGANKVKEIIRNLTKERDSLRKHSGDWAGPAHLKDHDFAIRGLKKSIGEEVEEIDEGRPSQSRNRYKELFGEEEERCAFISRKQIEDLEKFADKILDKFDIDIEFTKHFSERMTDSRNVPCIKVNELQQLFKKIAREQGNKVKRLKGNEGVLKDLQYNLNLPIVVNYKNGEFEVVMKTIMRKADFKTSNQTVTYESKE